MAAFRRIVEGLKGHDGCVHRARLYSKPDQALMRTRILRRNEQKHAQRRKDANDHHQIMRM
jgi:hypothetical protein